MFTLFLSFLDVKVDVKVKLKFNFFSWSTNYNFVIESINGFYFVNNVLVYKVFWYKEKVISLITKYLLYI